VTIGEALVTNARLLCMDEISTGLDSSVTFDILSSVRRVQVFAEVDTPQTPNICMPLQDVGAHDTRHGHRGAAAADTRVLRPF
jgi:hypothetical protein